MYMDTTEIRIWRHFRWLAVVPVAMQTQGWFTRTTQAQAWAQA